MKAYKNGISLIVFVVTVIVLSILAATVIISLSNTNIMAEASKTTFKNDMANIKEAYELYVASKMLGNINARESLNVTVSDAEKFTEIFGNNVKDEYRAGLQIIHGELMYKTTDTVEYQILKELNMEERTAIPKSLKPGGLVIYVPTTDPEGSYPGATYVKDIDEASDTYNTYIESETNYTPGILKWVYLGQDENGNALLTSQDVTGFTMTIAGQDGWVNGPDRMDALCKTLYGNTTYAKETRNMKTEDVNRVLGYNGPKAAYYAYYNEDIIYKRIDEPMTFKEIEKLEGVAISQSHRRIPRLSTTEFDNCLVDHYWYTGETYKDQSTDEYKVIFTKSDGTAFYSYWLSSKAARLNFKDNYATFDVGHVFYGQVDTRPIYYSGVQELLYSYNLRPVIVLNSNVQFGEKTDAGWTLVEM